MTNQIKVVNTITGEVLELPVDSMEQMATAYIQLKGLEGVIKRLKTKLNERMLVGLGEAKAMELPDRSRIVRVEQLMRTYDKSVVAQFLDADQMEIVTKIDATALKTLMKELVDEGIAPKGAWKAIEDSAETKPKKPYVIVEELKP